MNLKTKIKRAVKNADISDSDWIEDVVEQITEPYARGYFDAKISEMNESLSFSSEDFREEMLEICDYDIWGKEK